MDELAVKREERRVLNAIAQVDDLTDDQVAIIHEWFKNEPPLDSHEINELIEEVKSRTK